MTSMWTNLVPLILVSAFMPIELAIVLMLLDAPSRVRAASAAITGMVTVRLLQGFVFGGVLHWGTRTTDGSGAKPVLSTILLIVALMFLVTAAREIAGGDDPDAPPPKWMNAVTSMSPARAFLLGAGAILIAVKLWVFTFGAIGAIGAAGLPWIENVAVYLVFVLLCVSPHITIVVAAALFPERSRSALRAALAWLQDHNRKIMITLGVVFGTWFLLKALHGFGFFERLGWWPF